MKWIFSIDGVTMERTIVFEQRDLRIRFLTTNELTYASMQELIQSGAEWDQVVWRALFLGLIIDFSSRDRVLIQEFVRLCEDYEEHTEPILQFTLSRMRSHSMETVATDDTIDIDPAREE